MQANQQNLTEATYFSHEARTAFTSCTEIKSFLACESRALAMVRGEWTEEPGTALLVGSFIDSHFSGTLNLFVAHHPELFTKQGQLKAEYRQAENIIQRIERDEAMMHYLSGQPQVIMTGEIDGVPVKIKIDSLLPDVTVDLKIMRDMESKWVEGEGRKSFVEAWGYDIQGAIYQYIRAQNEGGEIKPFILAVATKEDEPDIALIRLPQDMLDEALEVVRDNIVYIDGLKKGLYPPQRCEKCAYCRATKKLTGPIDYKLLFDMEV